MTELGRLLGVTFGTDARDYSFTELEKVIGLANKTEADGIQVRFWGDVEPRGSQLIPVAGLSVDEIVSICNAIQRHRKFSLELHLTEYLLAILDSYPDFAEELTRFQKIVGHYVVKKYVTYDRKSADASSKAVTVQHLPGIENIIEYLQDKALSSMLKRDGKSVRFISDLWQRLLIENHIPRGSSLISISKIAEKYDIRTCFDMGHLVRAILEQRDSPDNYIIRSSEGIILRPEIINYAKRIDQVQVHWVTKTTEGYIDHVPPADATTAPPEVHYIICLILGRAIATNYAIELRKPYHSPKNVRAAAEAFENLWTKAKTAYNY